MKGAKPTVPLGFAEEPVRTTFATEVLENLPLLYIMDTASLPFLTQDRELILKSV